MSTKALNNYDEHLKQYNASILAGISQVRDYCIAADKLDEYTYILLWRPVEWIIEYCALIEYKERSSDKTEVTIENFIAERKLLNVDQKVDIIKSSELSHHYDEMDFLRWCRNSVIYHYVEEPNRDPFECFDSICEEFVRIYCPKAGYAPISSLNCHIQFSEIASEYDTDIDHIYERIQSVISYMNNSQHNKVISICKMEELAQLLVYKILKDDYQCTIQYIINGKKGIYINGEPSKSYIDYFTNNYKDNFITKNLCQKLDLLRSTRNKAMHVFDITDEIEADFRLLWATIINTYFGYEKKISKLLGLFLNKENLQKSIRNLTRDNKYIENESNHNAIVSVGRHLSLINDALEKTHAIYNTLVKELSENPDSTIEDIFAERAAEISDILNSTYRNVDESTQERYREMAKAYFRANYSNNEGTYHYLETALLLYNIIGDYSYDKAGICIELTRALENYLYYKIAVKLKAYMQENPDVKINEKAKRSIELNKPTLGTYHNLYRSHNTEYSNAFLEFCSSNNIYTIDDENELKNEIYEEMETIKAINNNYRIPIAHREQINTDLMNNCMRDILTGSHITDPDVGTNDSESSTPEVNPILKRISEAMGDTE